MSARLQRRADVAGKSADVGAFAANNSQANFVCRERKQFDFIDG
jgi:hypothetical protein